MAAKAELAAAGGKFVLVAVLADESTDDAAAALKKWGVDAPFLVDRGGALRRELRVESLPATVIVDSAGKVVWVAPAAASPSDVVAAARAIRPK